MSSAPLIQTEGNAPEGTTLADQGQGAVQLKRCAKLCGLAALIVALAVFTLIWLVQGLIYAWATNLSGCRAGTLANFNYDGDADVAENPEYNLMPRIALLTERDPKWRRWSVPWYVFPSNEASTVAGAQVGTWWKTWGPIFETYTYEDMSSKTTIYMRRNLMRIGSSHRIARCDGKPPFVTFTEGSNWISNRFRTAFGFNQAMTFKIYNGSDLVAYAEESSGDIPSMTFRNVKNDWVGSSVLVDPNFHGHKSHWLVKNNETTPLPYFVSNAASLLFALHSLRLAGGVPAALLAPSAPLRTAGQGAPAAELAASASPAAPIDRPAAAAAVPAWGAERPEVGAEAEWRAEAEWA